MVISTIIATSILLIYGLILWTIATFWSLENNALYDTTKRVCIIIAARNEEKQITSCVTSVLDNSYPRHLLQIIVVDDHSTDGTIEVLTSLRDDDRLTLLELPEGKRGKKEAISYAIQQTDAEIILTTDADCVVGPQWIQTMTACLSEKLFVTGPVTFTKSDSALARYQLLDLMGMMAVTSYGIGKKKYYLANGANMGFKRKIFLDINGYAGNDHLASGDDLFLVQKIAKQDPDKIGFASLLEAIVVSQPEDTCESLFQQRKRWATKSMTYNDLRLKTLLAFIFLCNLMIPILFVLGGVYCWFLASVAIMIFYFKLIVDYFFLKKLSTSYPIKGLFKHFILSEVMTIVIVIYSGLVGLFPRAYHWKGRKVK